MRRSSLKTYTPLGRQTRLNPKRDKPRRTTKVRDQAYKDRVKLLPCVAPGAPASCWWAPGEHRSDPSHTGKHGMGMKADDTSCVPKCRGHHDEWEQRRGVFAGWSQEQRDEWAAARVAETQARLAAPLPDWA